MKQKYNVQGSYGKGKISTLPLHGYVQQLIIKPSLGSTIWSVKIIDRDGDEVYSQTDCEGTLNDQQGFPVGKDKPEILTILLDELTFNDNFSIILIIKEVR